VLFLHHAAVLGGAERSLLDLITHLDPNRWDPVVALPGDGPLGDRLRAGGVAVRIVPIRRLTRSRDPRTLARGLWALVAATWTLVALIRRDRIGAIHANSASALIFGAPAAHLTRVPILWHVRDFVPVRRLVRLLASRCACVIAISRCVLEDLRDQLPTGIPLVLVPNGIDPGSSSMPADRRASPECQADGGRPPKVVAMVAHLVPWKKHAVFLRAAADVWRRHPDARFVVVGDDLFGDHPHYRAELERLAASLGLAESLAFAGAIDDVPAWLERVTCLVLPSEREPFGRVLIEAMAAGKPVVAVRRCGPSEIVRDRVDGFLAEPGESAEMADAVVRLLSDPGLAESLGANGRARVREQFTIVTTAARFHRVLDAVARTGRRPRGMPRPCELH
jgi:glycosyltransferase involved in cell wall biosynthesis